MNRYSRRDFLKSIAALAVGSQLPIPDGLLAEIASPEPEPVVIPEKAQPEPVGYLGIAGLAMEVDKLEIDQDLGTAYTVVGHRSAGRPTWELRAWVRGYHDIPIGGDEINYELSAPGYRCQGKGYVTQITHSGSSDPGDWGLTFFGIRSAGQNFTLEKL